MVPMAQIHPLHILIASFAGWMNRHQAEVLEYLIEENRVLKEQRKGKALRLNDDQRRRLAAKGKRIGRRLLMRVATIVTPDTILRWQLGVGGVSAPLRLQVLEREHASAPHRRQEPCTRAGPALQ